MNTTKLQGSYLHSISKYLGIIVWHVVRRLIDINFILLVQQLPCVAQSSQHVVKDKASNNSFTQMDHFAWISDLVSKLLQRAPSTLQDTNTMLVLFLFTPTIGLAAKKGRFLSSRTREHLFTRCLLFIVCYSLVSHTPMRNRCRQAMDTSYTE